MNDEPEKKANAPNEEELEIELPEEEIEFISTVGDFDTGSENDPSLEKTEELHVLKNGKPYTTDELDVFSERMFSMFRPTGQDIESWIEHGYTDLLHKKVYPNFEKYIDSRKKEGYDVQEDEKKLAYMKDQSTRNLRYKLNHPWKMSIEEKKHFNNRSNILQRVGGKKNSSNPLDDKELNELVNGLYSTKLKAGKIHADFAKMNEKQRNEFENEYKSQIKTYFKNLQENGLTHLVRDSHIIYAGDESVSIKLRNKIVEGWQKDSSAINLTDDICVAMGFPTKTINSEKVVDDSPETLEKTEKAEESTVTDLIEKSANEKKDTVLNTDHPDSQTLTKIDKKPTEDELLDFADNAMKNPKQTLETIKKEKQLQQSQYQPGEKVVITKDNGEQQEDTVSKVEQQDSSASPTVHTEMGQTLKAEDSKIKEQETTADPEVKHQKDFLSDKEYTIQIEEQKQLSISAQKMRTACNLIANAFRKFDGYDESKDPYVNMKNLIEFVGYKTTGVLKQKQDGLNYMSVKIDDLNGTVFDYMIDKDISTKEKFKQSLYNTNKQTSLLEKQINKNAEKEINRLSKERLEASEYRRVHNMQEQGKSQKKTSGISIS